MALIRIYNERDGNEFGYLVGTVDTDDYDDMTPIINRVIDLIGLAWEKEEEGERKGTG